jgi:very-short-patch-repair endonuclease
MTGWQVDVATLPPRLVVYEAVDVGGVSRTLADAGIPVALQTAWDAASAAGAPDIDGPRRCWLWPSSEEEFLAVAPTLLREFVFPLVQSAAPFLLGLPVSRGRLAPRRLDVSQRGLLDEEDIGLLLERDTVGVTPETLLGVSERVALTPIEQRLRTALAEEGVSAEPQVRLGRYIADFVVDTPSGKLVVEADGRDYHDLERDAQRDAALRERGVWRVLRFTGAAIWRDPTLCAMAVARAAQNGTRSHAPRVALDADMDADQRAAATHGAGPVRILAPAGAGKTKTMINRVCTLIERGVSPSSILVLAFNVKAKDQLVERLRARRIPVNDRHVYHVEEPGVVCATFNAFGYRYGREIIGIKPDLLSRAEGRALMGHALDDAGVSLKGAARGSDPVGQYLRVLDRVRNELFGRQSRLRMDPSICMVSGPRRALPDRSRSPSSRRRRRPRGSADESTV